MTHEAGSFPPHGQPVSPLRHGPAQVPDLAPGGGSEPVLIDCDSCQARGAGCGDCFVTVLMGGPPAGVSLNEEERRAVDVLAAAGLIPPLRHVYGVEAPSFDPE